MNGQEKKLKSNEKAVAFAAAIFFFLMELAKSAVPIMTLINI